mmetsp:Transcript_28847/g.61317  ORF Transcript_28847/g.61317 Transcript_28847/m.61317 type:complete len:101 (+) Transcript_28847:72-374(+)
MANRSAATLLPIAILAVLALVTLRGSSFVPPPAAGLNVQSLRGAAPAAAAALYGVAAAGIPEPAAAITIKEWNQFGLVFAAFSLVFFVAGLARMLTTGKL